MILQIDLFLDLSFEKRRQLSIPQHQPYPHARYHRDMIETASYQTTLPELILGKYTFLETGSASKIAEVVSPEAFSDIVNVLDDFSLTPQLLLTRGGSRGPIPRLIDGAFAAKGWMEARVDLYKRAFLVPGHNGATVEDDPLGLRAEELKISESYQKGYSVDNVKGRIALDVEWNPKDGNLDRDFSAYRAWHEEGLIDVAFLITRIQADTKQLAARLWEQFIATHPEYQHETQPVDYGTTTTANFEKARERVLRGDLGTCPILVIGIGEKTWDGTQWDGQKVQFVKEEEKPALVNAFI